MNRKGSACCRSHSRRQKVEIAHMELAEPSIGAAVAKCASEGYKKVVVAPYFLSRGRHITSDIPAMVAEAQEAHPEVSCVIADPIGMPPVCSCMWVPFNTCLGTGVAPCVAFLCLRCFSGGSPADLHAALALQCVF